MIRTLLIFALACLAGCAASSTRIASDTHAMQTSGQRMIVVTVRNDVGSIATRAGSTYRGYGAGNYAVTATARMAVKGLASTYKLHEVSGWPIAVLGVHCVVFQVPPDVDPAKVLNQLTHDSRVESAQLLQSFATLATYNDPYESLQRNLNAMEVTQAHDWSRGKDVRIAVVDTGVDTEHPDLAGRVATQRNFVDADEWAFVHDRHGTAVAGVIAAVANNNLGIVGVAPEARLYAYKACWQTQSDGAGAVCNTFTLAKALAAAIDDRVQIVNLSLAGPRDSLLARLVERGLHDGIVFVGALPPQNAAPGFPCDIAGVVSVDMTEKHALNERAVLAPGADLLTLAPEGHYDFASGSSLATANVSGIVALLLARNQKLRGVEIEQLLARTANPTSVSVPAKFSVNACSALVALLQQPACHVLENSSIALDGSHSSQLPQLH